MGTVAERFIATICLCTEVWAVVLHMKVSKSDHRVSQGATVAGGCSVQRTVMADECIWLSVCHISNETLPSGVPRSRRDIIVTMQRNSFMLSFISYQMDYLNKDMHVISAENFCELRTKREAT